MNPIIQRVIGLMLANLDGKLSLNAMASSVNLSSSRLRHKFKAEIGLTPTAYMQMLRMERAKELLTSGLIVKQVKLAVGVTSDSYFTNCFKRTYGSTPSQAQKASSGSTSHSAATSERTGKHPQISLIALAPDVQEYFQDSDSVNAALRTMIAKSLTGTIA